MIDALEEAAAAGLATSRGVRGRYVFTHTLVRQALYGELSMTRRLRLHLRAAQAIESAYDPDRLGEHAGALAAHYRLAGAAADRTRRPVVGPRRRGGSAHVCLRGGRRPTGTPR